MQTSQTLQASKTFLVSLESLRKFKVVYDVLERLESAWMAKMVWRILKNFLNFIRMAKLIYWR